MSNILRIKLFTRDGAVKYPDNAYQILVYRFALANKYFQHLFLFLSGMMCGGKGQYLGTEKN